MKRILNILIFSFAFFAFFVPAGVFALPAFPMNFDGTVTINGSNAPIGSVVGVYDVNSDLLAQFTLTTAGVYGTTDRKEVESAKLSVPSYSGSSFTFKINSPSYNTNAILADTETYPKRFSEFLDVTQNLVFTGATLDPCVTSINITDTSASVGSGSTQQFTAIATYFNATTADITTSCTWTSSSAGVATIGTNTGLATGVSAGSSTITASYTDGTYGVLTDTASLTVTASGGGGGGGGGGASIPMPTTATGEVTATYAGGAKTSITNADSTKATVKFLPYAVSTGTKISVKAISKTATKVSSAVFAVLSGKTIVGNYVYDFSAEKSGSAVTEFSKDVTITLTYTDAQIKGLKESSLRISYWDTDKQEWVALKTTVYKTSNKLIAKTSHFTYFAIMGEEGVDGVSGITKAQIREQINNIIKQIIVLITKLITVYQAQLLELQTQ